VEDGTAVRAVDAHIGVAVGPRDAQGIVVGAQDQEATEEQDEDIEDRHVLQGDPQLLSRTLKIGIHFGVPETGIEGQGSHQACDHEEDPHELSVIPEVMDGIVEIIGGLHVCEFCELCEFCYAIRFGRPSNFADHAKFDFLRHSMKHQELLKQPMTQSEKEIPPVTPNQPKKPKKPRCPHKECRTKIGLISFTCKCGKTFCVAHQSPHSHDCSYDHGQDKRNDIQTKNPSVIPQKLVVV
jgi:hypothetical protein